MTRLLHRCAPIHSSALAQLVNEAPDAHERRRAVTLYRRTARSMCITVACLVTNALWLASARDARERPRDCITETLRLMPPAWMYHRNACQEFTAVDARIRETDDVLVIPLITQRDPRHWPDADAYEPDRWLGVSNRSLRPLPAVRPFARPLLGARAGPDAGRAHHQADRHAGPLDRQPADVGASPLKSLLCPTRVNVVAV